MRCWTARPRAIHAAARAWGRLSFQLRTSVSRVMAWLEAGEDIVAGGLQARLLLAHARRTERRRGAMLGRLGEAVYTEDDAARRHLEAELRRLDTELASVRVAADALRETARRKARRALASARSTQIREPGSSRRR